LCILSLPLESFTTADWNLNAIDIAKIRKIKGATGDINGLERFKKVLNIIGTVYTVIAKTFLMVGAMTLLGLCIASFVVAVPQLTTFLGVVASVLTYPLMVLTGGLVTGPMVVSAIAPLFLAGSTSIILVAIFALAIAVRFSYVWWKSIRSLINDARSNPKVAFSKAKDQEKAIITSAIYSKSQTAVMKEEEENDVDKSLNKPNKDSDISYHYETELGDAYHETELGDAYHETELGD
jgi:hypothetical protein